ncbi:MAG TPA: hypothetical protein VGH34_18865 [Vicinamibacterales bacterium]|jgi:hypothetical protein
MQWLFDHPWLLGLLTAFLLSGAIEAGSQTGLRSRIQDDANRKEQMVAIRDALFVLTSLLLGFTLALVAPRYADRRSVLIDEANAIGTTFLRAETLQEPHRGRVQRLLQQYVDARLDLGDAGLDEARQEDAIDRSKQIQARLWQDLVDVAGTDRSAVTTAYMNALNETFDLHEKRVSAIEYRIPRPIWLLIFSVSTITVFTRGLTLSRRFWLTLVLAPLTIAIVIALIADLDTAGSGLIRIDQGAMQRLKVAMTVKP